MVDYDKACREFIDAGGTVDQWLARQLSGFDLRSCHNDGSPWACETCADEWHAMLSAYRKSNPTEAGDKSG